MIRKIILSSILFFTFSTIKAQVPPDNLGFEYSTVNSPAFLWTTIGSEKYTYTLNTDTFKEGKQSLVIANDDKLSSNGDFGGVYFEFPNKYVGKEMELTAYVKTDDVNGIAGIFYKTDQRMPLQYADVNGIQGSNDWQKISLKHPIKQSHIDQIGIGVMLRGSGTVWIDDVELKIDGKDYKQSEIYIKPVYKADLDKQFDNGSKVDIPFKNYTDGDWNKLALLGKVWGFLKYHHPVIATGEFNWDYELFRMLPGYLLTKDNKSRDAYLLGWIDRLGTLPNVENKSKNGDRLKWLDEYDVSHSLQERLIQIGEYQIPQDHYYIAQGRYAPTAEYTNEQAYTQFTLPDEGFRLLALYRYWSMVEYFYPYKELTDNKWSNVLKTNLQAFLEATTELKYELALTALFTELNDTHALLLDGNHALEQALGENYAPIRLNKVEGKWIVTEIYNPELVSDVDIKIGDQITQIGGNTIEEIEASYRNRYPASNDAVYYRDVQRDMLRSVNDNLDIVYLSNNKLKKATLKLYKRKDLNIYYTFRIDKTKKGFYLLENNIGYITLGNITNEDIEELKHQFINTKGIIIDARNYPSAYVPYSLGGYFVSKPTPFLKALYPSLNQPGLFEFGNEMKLKPSKVHYQGKVVVLINEVSQSASEYAIMAFKAGENVTLVGGHTAGANGHTEQVVLPGNRIALIGGQGIFYPDGKPTQRIGIKPDVEVGVTRKGIMEGKDEVLDHAIELIMVN